MKYRQRRPEADVFHSAAVIRNLAYAKQKVKNNGDKALIFSNHSE
jgi:hypothetical protein